MRAAHVVCTRLLAACALATFVLAFFVASAHATSPGIASPIHTIYLMQMAHLDIGFTDPPDRLADEEKTVLDTVVALADRNPDYIWNVESLWQLEQWMIRSTPAQISHLVDVVHRGQINLMAGYANMHSDEMGEEETNRIFTFADSLRRAWSVPIQTVVNDDVPGASWAYPTALHQSGVRHLVCGLNMWIGGGTSIPRRDYPFYWVGPEGDSVLTWPTPDTYLEATFTYGLWSVASAYDSLSKLLPQWVADGYPYDAILVLAATGDNGPASIAQTSVVRQWNATYDNPKIVVGTPEQFFQHLHETYGDAHPTYRGDWGGFWDAGTVDTPHALAAVRRAHDVSREVETLASVASILGLAPYPSATDRFVRVNMLEFDDHNGGGAPWPGELTMGETKRQSTIIDNYAFRADSATSATLASTLPLVNAQVTTPEPAVVVWNTLSWPRTGSVRIALPDWSTVRLYDPVRDEYPALERLAATGEVVFVARDVPGVGYAAYYRRSAVGTQDANAPRAPSEAGAARAADDPVLQAMRPGALNGSAQAPCGLPGDARSIFLAPDRMQRGLSPERRSGPAVSEWIAPLLQAPEAGAASDATVENEFFRITVSGTSGTITSLYDKTAGRELVNAGAAYPFNGLIRASNLQSVYALWTPISLGTATAAVTNAAPEHTIAITRAGSTMPSTTITLYDGVPSVTIADVVDRTPMRYVTYDLAFDYYDITFPFALGPFSAYIDWQGRWGTPVADNLPASEIPYFVVHHGGEMNEGAYGVRWASPEAMVWEWDQINAFGKTFAPHSSSVLARLIKKEDEAQYKNTGVGRFEQEPGTSPQYPFTVVLGAHAGGFDPVGASRFGWEAVTPLRAARVDVPQGGMLPGPRATLFDAGDPAVQILTARPAERAPGWIVRLANVSSGPLSTTLGSSAFVVTSAEKTDLVESSAVPLPITDGRAQVTLRPWDIVSVRIGLALRPTAVADRKGTTRDPAPRVVGRPQVAADGAVGLALTQEANLHGELLDVTGRIVGRYGATHAAAGRIVLPPRRTTTLPAGVYMLRLFVNAEAHIWKVVRVR
jgi:hypothetical protein